MSRWSLIILDHKRHLVLCYGKTDFVYVTSLRHIFPIIHDRPNLQSGEVFQEQSKLEV